MAVPQLITNPETGETKSLTQWAKTIGVTTPTFARRVRMCRGEPNLIFSTAKAPQTTGGRWTKAEDELLKSLFSLPNAIARYLVDSQKYHLPERARDAVETRVCTLQKRGELPIRKGDLQVALESGYLSSSQLASCLNISKKTVDTFFLKMLKYEETPTGRVVELRRFVKWATTPVGAVVVAKAVKQDEVAIAWLVQTIGKWLWVG